MKECAGPYGPYDKLREELHSRRMSLGCDHGRCFLVRETNKMGVISSKSQNKVAV